MTELRVPERLAATCGRHAESAAWLERLPGVVRELERRWSLVLGEPFEQEASCAWVAPVQRGDGVSAVLKLGMPHMEAEHEIAGLRFWAGDPTVRLLEADEALNAMLLERCEPGMHLRARPEAEQDAVIAGLLRRLWREPAQRHLFRTLAEMTAYWSEEALAEGNGWTDEGLLGEGLRLFAELPRTASRRVLLATDLHAGNVLSAGREPWLAIDPKPFVGDPAYDATQHLLNCGERLRGDAEGLIGHFAGLLGVEGERVRLWVFARLVVEWGRGREEWVEVVRRLAP